MTLDPQVQAFLDQLAALEGPHMSELPLEDARALYRGLAQMADIKDVAIGKVENRTIPGPAGEIPIRIYAPVAPARTLPGVIFFHGGGFVIGDLETHDALCRFITQQSGAKVVAVDYRLAPEHPYPAAVEDALAASRWIEKNAADLGIDPNRLATAGDSAGGNLATVVAQQGLKSGPKIAYQLLMYPVVQMAEETASRAAFGEGYLLDAASLTWFERCYVPQGTDVRDPRLSPLYAEDVSGLAPAYIITADYDVLRDEGRAYARKLEAAGVDVTYVNYDGMIHGFCHMAGIIDIGRKSMDAACAALKDALAD